MMFVQNLQKPLTVSIMQLSSGLSEFSLIVVFLAGIPFSLILLAYVQVLQFLVRSRRENLNESFYYFLWKVFTKLESILEKFVTSYLAAIPVVICFIFLMVGRKSVLNKELIFCQHQ